MRDVGDTPQILIETDDGLCRCYRVTEIELAMREWESIAVAAGSATH